MPALTFPGNMIGLVVRGKTGPDHHPGVMEQHADCILPNGAPIGFFGDDGVASGGSSSGQGSSASSGRSSSSGSFASPGRSSGSSSNSTGMNMRGAVFSYLTYLKARPYYVDVAQARKYKVKSTVLTINVTAAEAKAFQGYWDNLTKKPGPFYLLGYNCSTHASEAFIEAGIVDSGIPGLDTPDHLYDQLIDDSAGNVCRIWASYSGYVGFVQAGPDFTVVIEET